MQQWHQNHCFNSPSGSSSCHDQCRRFPSRPQVRMCLSVHRRRCRCCCRRGPTAGIDGHHHCLRIAASCADLHRPGGPSPGWSVLPTQPAQSGQVCRLAIHSRCLWPVGCADRGNGPCLGPALFHVTGAVIQGRGRGSALDGVPDEQVQEAEHRQRKKSKGGTAEATKRYGKRWWSRNALQR
jgi:hypothetical protein